MIPSSTHIRSLYQQKLLSCTLHLIALMSRVSLNSYFAIHVNSRCTSNGARYFNLFPAFSNLLYSRCMSHCDVTSQLQHTTVNLSTSHCEGKTFLLATVIDVLWTSNISLPWLLSERPFPMPIALKFQCSYHILSLFSHVFVWVINICVSTCVQLYNQMLSSIKNRLMWTLRCCVNTFVWMHGSLLLKHLLTNSTDSLVLFCQSFIHAYIYMK